MAIFRLSAWLSSDVLRQRKKLFMTTFAILSGLTTIYQLGSCYRSQMVLSGHREIINGCSSSSSYTLNDSYAGIDFDIPNIIHQMWKSSNISSYPAAASYPSWRDAFEPLNYTVSLWTDEELHELVRTNYSWLLPTYEGYSQNIQRADVARLLVLHAYGGIYMDLDVHPISIAEVSCLQRLGHQAILTPTSGASGVSNHFIMAQKGSKFIEWLLLEAEQRGGYRSRRIILPYLRVFWSTGPMMVTSAFEHYASVFGLKTDKIAILDEAYGTSVIFHAAGRSWHGQDGRVLNFIADHLMAVFLAVSVILVGLVVSCWRRVTRPTPLISQRLRLD